MTDKRMKVFAAAAKLQSFTEAGNFLHLTQPAVTFQIKRLEDEIGAELFTRASSRVQLTPVGEVVLKYALRLQDTYDEMGKELQQLMNPTEPVPYKPENAEAADKFRRKFCQNCINRPENFGVNCGIWVKAEQEAFSKEPIPEWQYLKGAPVCTAFQRR